MMIHLIFTCIEENDLLSKFLKHYKEQGCENVICLLEPDINRAIVSDIFPSALIYSGPISLDARIRHNDDNWMRKKIPDGDWYINLDVDEFVLPKNKTLCDIIINTKHDHIRGYLVDRHTKDYHLPKFLEEDIWKQFPVESRFTEEHGACTSKIIAASKEIEIEIGHHGCKSDNYDQKESLPIYHFKWWGRVRERLKKRNNLTLPWNKEISKELKTLWKYCGKGIKM